MKLVGIMKYKFITIRQYNLSCVFLLGIIRLCEHVEIPLQVEPFFCEWIKKNIPEWQNCIVVSPDEGAVKRAVSVANDLSLDFALIHNRSRLNKLYSTVVPDDAMGASAGTGSKFQIVPTY